MDRVHERRWASKASWRLTFTVWSLVLVVWAAVTVLIDQETLLLIRRVTGTNGRTAIAVLALAIVLPVLIDAGRFAWRYSRLYRARSGHAGVVRTWGRDVPARTPRRFRGDAAGDLTWRERAIVEQGQLAYGEVVHQGPMSHVRLTTSWGDTLASRPVPTAEPRPRDGATVPILFEPGASVGVAPTLLELEFAQVTPVDGRGQIRRSPSSRRPSRATSARLLPTLHPVERMSRYSDLSVGDIALADGKLTSSPSAGEPVSVRLDQPFSVETTVFLLDDDTAELNLRVTQSSQSAYRAGDEDGIVVKTELPSARIDRSLRTGWVDACYVDQTEFRWLWAALIDASDDDALRERVAV